MVLHKAWPGRSGRIISQATRAATWGSCMNQTITRLRCQPGSKGKSRANCVVSCTILIMTPSRIRRSSVSSNVICMIALRGLTRLYEELEKKCYIADYWLYKMLHNILDISTMSLLFLRVYTACYTTCLWLYNILYCYIRKTSAI